MRFFQLLAASSAGVLAALVAARALLLQLPRPTPDTASSVLALEQRWALNPERRRQAALLRASAANGQPALQQALLAGQGWGQGTLAAVVLKQQALAAATLGQPERAKALWQLLMQRHSGEPASADGLYALGRQRPQLRQRLLRRWPAHPAALAAASELSGTTGALHLARWGARWPGAGARIKAACNPRTTAPQLRQQLAQGLAELGEPQEALACLAGTRALPATQLLIAQSELHGSDAEQAAAPQRLLAIVQANPQGPEAEEAVRLLAAETSPAAKAALSQLPPQWQRSAPVQAGRALQAPGIAAALAVLKRWPNDPASWELQWQRARQSALDGDWRNALALLQADGPQQPIAMPAALQARRRFWLGLSHWQLGQRQAAWAQWQQLRRQWPGGYYGWRAAARLGQVDDQRIPPPSASQRNSQENWSPLESGSTAADLLWRVGQPLEAWELWRSERRGQAPAASRALLAEGRLREAIGDGWTGLGQQELAALRLAPGQCRLQQAIETSLHRPRQLDALAAAARSEQVPLNLLLGVAKQESRFQSDVRSVVGAIGLLQLMPQTAAELHGAPLTGLHLNDAERNARLGGRYLRQLLQRWSGNGVLAVASYNAGPNAVAGWLTPTLASTPELWIEAIPYPETRHYVKTVLGNSWSFAAPRLPACS